MRNVDIQVHVIAKTQVDDAGVRQWLDGIGANGYVWPQPEQEITSAEGVTGLAAKRCYLSFEKGLNPNVTKVRQDWTEYFDNILKSGHGSVLEHATYTFAFEGVTRVFTAEMNRHRAGVAISEGSMRYIRFTDIPWWMPLSLRLTESEVEYARIYGISNRSALVGTSPDGRLVIKKLRTQEIFAEVFTFCQDSYTKLVELWELDTDKSLPFHYKKLLTSCLRRIIPIGVSTGAVYTLNMRALRHILALRTSAAAEEEIAYVFSLVAKKMVEAEPRLLGDFAQTPEGYWVPRYSKV